MVVGFDSIVGFDLNQVQLVARAHGIPFEVALPYLEIVEDEYLSIVKRKKKAAKE